MEILCFTINEQARSVETPKQNLESTGFHKSNVGRYYSKTIQRESPDNIILPWVSDGRFYL